MLTPISNQKDTLLTIQEVAQRLRVDDTTVRRWIKNGTLPAIPLPAVGTRLIWRVPQSALDHVLNTSTH